MKNEEKLAYHILLSLQIFPVALRMADDRISSKSNRMKINFFLNRFPLALERKGYL